MTHWQGLESFLELLALGGPSGHEHRVAQRLGEWFRAEGLAVDTDPLGNVLAYCRGEGDSRPSLLVATHMDEIGLMVADIETGGFLRVTPIGGIDPRTLLSAEVVVHGRKDLPGVIGAKPPHLSTPEERNQAPRAEDLFVDLGMPEEAVRRWVRPGDPMTVRRQPVRLLGDVVAGKSVDNRASVAAVFECLRWLRSRRLKVDVIFAATVQEEVGLRGAAAAAYRVRPDVGIAVDVCHARSPGVSSDRTVHMGSGPAVQFGPNIHPKLFQKLTETARTCGVSWQLLVGQGPTGTDARIIQLTREGVPTAALGIPIRYMHTSVETVDYRDIRETGRLLAEWIASLDRPFVEGLTCFFND
ncbi:MAG: M42 family metallopeptidase [Alicyclobacillaceae bacterium]|nr:M42 family metallopeptidase [Alicyclobacillaceae bacterium]